MTETEKWKAGARELRQLARKVHQPITKLPYFELNDYVVDNLIATTLSAAYAEGREDERQNLVARIQSTTWSGSEEIVAMIRQRRNSAIAKAERAVYQGDPEALQDAIELEQRGRSE